MRRDEDVIATGFRRFKYLLHMLTGLVLGYARADNFPARSFLAQHIVLRVDEYDGRVGFLDGDTRGRGGGLRLDCSSRQSRCRDDTRATDQPIPPRCDNL